MKNVEQDRVIEEIEETAQVSAKLTDIALLAVGLVLLSM